MKKLLAGLGAILSSSAIVAPAGAAIKTTDVQTVQLGSQTPTNYTASGTFNLFDTSLGKLIAMSVFDSYGIATTLTITNNPAASSSSNGYAITDSTLTVSAADTNQSSVIKRLLKTTDATSDKVYYSDLAPGSSFTDSATSSTAYTPNTAAGADHFVTTSLSADLAYFAASAGNTTGTVMGKTASTTLVSSDNGNTSAAQTTQGSGLFKIFFSYDPDFAVSPVPEPANWGLMILGFGMTGTAMRRARKTTVAFAG